jgi:hypothetical protein
VTEKASRLLSVVKGEMSVREMMAALGFASRDKFLKNYLSPALKAGLVEMTEPDRRKKACIYKFPCKYRLFRHPQRSMMKHDEATATKSINF